MPKKRCAYPGCKKKLSLTECTIGTCKCNNTYCMLHRLPAQHDCTFDFSVDREKFIEANKCVAAKV